MLADEAPRPASGVLTFAHACLALALTTIGAIDEAVASSAELLVFADTAANPEVASYSLLAYGIAHRDVDPLAAYEAHRRGQKIAQGTGNRQLGDPPLLTTLGAAGLSPGHLRSSQHFWTGSDT